MTNGKNKMIVNIDEKLISTIANISAKKGETVSSIVEMYLNKGVSKEIDLTSAERYNFNRIAINGSLDSVLRLFGVLSLEGGLSDKCTVLMALCKEKSLQEKSEIRNGIIEISFYEVLNDIKSFDIALWKKIIINMGKSGRIRNRYFQLYPK